MSGLSVWGYELNQKLLTPEEIDYVKSLPEELPSVEWVWAEMDRIWRNFGLDNAKPIHLEKIAAFYSHPIWLVNGIFTKLDPDSAEHRRRIARYLADHSIIRIADYGGGFGELAIAITAANGDATVDIIEPFPSKIGIDQISREPSITLVDDFGSDKYDAIIAQDILEHVEEPILLAHKLTESVKEGGFCIFANCFYPYIQCHLPSTFHLRHTFPIVMKAMGLAYVGVVPGVAHAQVFKRSGTLSLPVPYLAWCAC